MTFPTPTACDTVAKRDFDDNLSYIWTHVFFYLDSNFETFLPIAITSEIVIAVRGEIASIFFTVVPICSEITHFASPSAF